MNAVCLIHFAAQVLISPSWTGCLASFALISPSWTGCFKWIIAAPALISPSWAGCGVLRPHSSVLAGRGAARVVACRSVAGCCRVRLVVFGCGCCSLSFSRLALGHTLWLGPGWLSLCFAGRLTIASLARDSFVSCGVRRPVPGASPVCLLGSVFRCGLWPVVV